jgi:hypothetical protein
VQFSTFKVKVSLGPAGAAVTLNVSQTLLCYAKKTKRNIRRDYARNVLMGKLDLDVLQVFKLFAKCSHSRDKPKSLQSGRMQAMRQ